MHQLIRSPELKIYIESSARLAWKMALQRPPMRFDTSKEDQLWTKSEENELDLVLGSEPKQQGAKIQYYLSPVLIHGDQIMAKGKVFVN